MRKSQKRRYKRIHTRKAKSMYRWMQSPLYNVPLDYKTLPGYDNYIYSSYLFFSGATNTNYVDVIGIGGLND